MRQQFVWNFAAQSVGLVLPPALIIILARILEPSDFGIFALLMVVISVIQSMSFSPLGEVIIKSKREDIGDFIFSLQLVVGVIFSGIIYFGADQIAGFFNKPELASLLRFSCLLLLISPLVDTAIRMSMRKISFKAVFVRRVVSPIANAFVSIPLAIYGAGYWALYWGQLGGFVVAAIVVVAMGGWKPKFQFDLGKYIEDLKFTWQMILQSMVRWIRSQSDLAILGYNLQASVLGQYDMARKFAGMPFAVIVQPVAQVLYAVMADRIRKKEEIGDLFLVSQRRVLMITLPLCAVMMINAEGIVVLVLGEKWRDISSIFLIMSAVGGFSSLVGSNMEVFKAKDVPHIMTRFMLVRAAVTLPVFLWLAPKGVMELSYGVLGLALVFSPANVVLTIKLLGINLKSYITGVLYRPVLVTLVVCIANIASWNFSLELWQMTILNAVISGIVMLVAGLFWERELFKWKPVA